MDTLLRLVGTILLASSIFSEACVRVCYHTNWSQYRTGYATFVPENIDPDLCTHIVYAFATMEGGELAPFEWNDDSTLWSQGMYERVMKLKDDNTDLKVLLAVGGWNFDLTKLTAMLDTAATRKHFIDTSIDFLRDRDFDGLDFDYEYPGKRGSIGADVHKFTLLCEETKAAFILESADTGNERLLLTAAVAAGKSTVEGSYEVPALSQHLDLIHLMSYDLHGAWESKVGHNAPLYSRDAETGNDVYFNVEWAALNWVKKGAPANKLVIGIPTYARTFKLTNPSNYNLGDAASGAGNRGTYTKEDGFLAYYEVCKILAKPGVTKVRDSESLVPYVVDNDQWIGYDDQQSVSAKVKFIRDNGFAGSMVWAIDLDDFKNVCGHGEYPLLTTIKNELGDQCDSTSTTTTTSSTTTTATTTTTTPSSTTTTTTTPSSTSTTTTPSSTTTTSPISTTTTPSSTTTTTPSSTSTTTTPSSTTTTTSTTTSSTSSSTTTTPTTTTTEAAGVFTCTGKEYGFYGDPVSCTAYYQCWLGNAYPYECAERTNWNPIIGNCDWNYICRHDTQTIEANGGFICNAITVDGYYPHPSDCTVFFQCFYGATHRRQCAAGLVWNQKRKYCDWRRNNKC